MKDKSHHCGKRGFATLLSVLVVSAIGISVAVSTLLLGLDNSRNGYEVAQSARARALANACAEEAMLQLGQSNNFNGSGGLSLGGGTCNYNTSRAPKQTVLVTSYGTVGTIVRKVEITASVQKKSISIISWQEVADF